MIRKRLIAVVALTAIAGSAHAEDRRTQMFDDPDMNACWFGEASGCEAWARADGYATVSLICRQIGKADRCMPAEQVFDITLVAGPAQALVVGGSPDENKQNRFWLVLMIGRAADRARAAGSDAAIEGLRAAIAATVPDNIRWDSFWQMLKDKGL
jgi:hypothetical protein